MITIKDVEHVARLARLALSDEEKDTFTKQLDEIVDYFNLLNEVDTENVQPMAHAVPMKNVLRDDEAYQELSRDEMLSISGFEEDGFIRVPRITE